MPNGFLDRLKAIFASTVVRGPEDYRPLSDSEIFALYERCGDLGAFQKSLDMRVAFVAEACRDRRAARKPGAILKENVYRNERLATCADLDEASKVLRSVEANSRDDQTRRLREAIAAGRFKH